MSQNEVQKYKYSGAKQDGILLQLCHLFKPWHLLGKAKPRVFLALTLLKDTRSHLSGTLVNKKCHCGLQCVIIRMLQKLSNYF